MKENNNTILIVDDERDMLNLLTLEFEDFGFNVITAEGVEEAKTLLSVHPINIILSDLKMDGNSGIDLLEYVRAEYPKMPFLFMSGYTESEDGEGLGADYFFKKPFSLNSVVQQVKKALSLEV